MDYAIELFFDHPTERIISSFFRKIARQKISPSMLHSQSLPHISLMVFNTNDIPSILEKLEAISSTTSCLDLYFHGLGTFNSNVLFLAPSTTDELLELHQKVYRAIKPYSDPIEPWYRPGLLTYHCTLGLNLSAKEMAKAFSLALSAKLPKKFQVNRISLVAIHDDQKPLWVEPLFTLPFKKRS